MATLTEQLAVFTIIGLLTNAAVPTMLRAIGDSKVTAATLQLHQTSKQSRYDAIVNYGSIRSVAIYGGENPAIAECLDNVCGEKIALPKGVVVKSTFRGIDAKLAGKAGSDRATLISWASETSAGIGGSYGQHGTITFSHPWSNKRFCIVRGGDFGNTGEWLIRKDKQCK